MVKQDVRQVDVNHPHRLCVFLVAGRGSRRHVEGLGVWRLAAGTHRGVGLGVSDTAVVFGDRRGWLAGGSGTWTRNYVRPIALADFAVAVVAAAAAAADGLRFGGQPNRVYLALSLTLPILWVAAIRIIGGYELRFLGTGSDDFRKVLNAGDPVRTSAASLLAWAPLSRRRWVRLFLGGINDRDACT